MLWNRVPLNVQLVPKNNLTFKQTYIDTTKWTVADVEAHPCFVERLHQANKLDLIDQAEKTPAPAQAQASAAHALSSPVTAEKHSAEAQPTPQASTTPAASSDEKAKPKSIFDFGK